MVTQIIKKKKKLGVLNMFAFNVALPTNIFEICRNIIHHEKGTNMLQHRWTTKC